MLDFVQLGSKYTKMGKTILNSSEYIFKNNAFVIKFDFIKTVSWTHLEK